jgi:hypothetical protein
MSMHYTTFSSMKLQHLLKKYACVGKRSLKDISFKTKYYQAIIICNLLENSGEEAYWRIFLSTYLTSPHYSTSSKVSNCWLSTNSLRFIEHEFTRRLFTVTVDVVTA